MKDLETKFDIDYGVDPENIKYDRTTVDGGNQSEEPNITLRDMVRVHYAEKYEKVQNDVLTSLIEIQEQKLARSERRQKINEVKQKETELARDGYQKNVKPISKRLDFDNKMIRRSLTGLGIGLAAGLVASVSEPIGPETIGYIAGGVIAGPAVGIGSAIASAYNTETRKLSEAKNNVVSFFRDKYTAFQEEKLNGMYEALEYKLDDAEYHGVDYKDAFPDPDRDETKLEDVVETESENDGADM